MVASSLLGVAVHMACTVWCMRNACASVGEEGEISSASREVEKAHRAARTEGLHVL